MPDREKVIKGLEGIYRCISPVNHTCGDCPYQDNHVECRRRALSDALTMLKEQEAIPPHYTRLEYLVSGKVVEIYHPECPRCFKNGLFLWDAEIEKGQAYCKRCGQAVKWK